MEPIERECKGNRNMYYGKEGHGRESGKVKEKEDYIKMARIEKGKNVKGR